jgi:hypothetical protein
LIFSHANLCEIGIENELYCESKPVSLWYVWFESIVLKYLNVKRYRYLAFINEAVKIT